ncbi:hypothetical protein NDU88_003570 [Pleurodeles waltl]|uniref:Uncharacterized protein n=1 Tax=Pleurodeles waltl TaxID=8319 RepID=A0AAV7T574_PLEWA|nr:hypothetical protein NDU88_003570 [Pleurodeles waltl]
MAHSLGPDSTVWNSEDWRLRTSLERTPLVALGAESRIDGIGEAAPTSTDSAVKSSVAPRAPCGPKLVGRVERAGPPPGSQPAPVRAQPPERAAAPGAQSQIRGRRCPAPIGVSAPPLAIFFGSGSSGARSRPTPELPRCRTAFHPDGPSTRATASAMHVSSTQGRSSFHAPEAPQSGSGKTVSALR